MKKKNPVRIPEEIEEALQQLNNDCAWVRWQQSSTKLFGAF